jgi:hypothetical protein
MNKLPHTQGTAVFRTFFPLAKYSNLQNEAHQPALAAHESVEMDLIKNIVDIVQTKKWLQASGNT